MAIHTLAVSQQQQYQHTQSSGRTFSRIRPQTSMAGILNPEQSQSLSQSQTITDELSAETGISNSPASGQTTYNRPLNPRLESVRLILEAYFGKSLELEKYQVDFSGPSADGQDIAQNAGQAINAANNSSEFVVLDNQVFRAGEQVQVEEWFTRQQSLSYQMQGEFLLDDKQLSLNYEFNISSESTRYRRFAARAANLQDPLLVQFGSQSLGHIEGGQEFDINGDNSLDTLPVFSGDVGYLVFDKNANGRADDGSELFGPATGNGFNELAAFDSNQNGFIDKEDEHFEQLYLWQPGTAGENGEDPGSQPSWLSLDEAGIMAINLSAIATPYTFYDENDRVQAQMRQSSFAIGENGRGYGVHQVDVRI
ncbi:hypothetical protein SG34_023620 [Thalassomonas viridans]|uniref:VCBS repeat-containing protein n=1 Tax=Thalassomonas viridans TaxID=137584 RepID=A0AAE9Z0C7_9GAMM|nr:hypothetical protein [Thalassomonas viridans]WDE04300.1 hypothetical protein SG34_023620 [Thalassomonas viridans]